MSDLIEAINRLIPHAMHYAAMPRAHSDVDRDVANARAALAKLQIIVSDHSEIIGQMARLTYEWSAEIQHRYRGEQLRERLAVAAHARAILKKYPPFASHDPHR